MIEDLAKDYSEYMKVDIKSELRTVEDPIEDMLTRLDEFENLVNMVRADDSLCVDAMLPKILSSRQQLDALCDRIDKLEQFVNRVKGDVEMVEVRVSEAEINVGSNSSGKLKNIFKPLFFMKSPTEGPAKKPSRTPTYTAPSVFSTSDFFPPQDRP